MNRSIFIPNKEKLWSLKQWNHSKQIMKRPKSQKIYNRYPTIQLNQVVVHIRSSLEPQIDVLNKVKGSAVCSLERNICFAGRKHSILPKQRNDQRLHFDQRKTIADAVTRTIHKRYRLERELFWVVESLGSELVRILQQS